MQPTPDEDGDVLTLGQVADRLGYNPAYVGRLARAGRIPGLLPRLDDRRGSHWRVSRTVFEAYLQGKAEDEASGDDGEAA